MREYDDYTQHPDDNKPFYCPWCSKPLGWYDSCCDESTIEKGA